MMPTPFEPYDPGPFDAVVAVLMLTALVYGYSCMYDEARARHDVAPCDTRAK